MNGRQYPYRTLYHRTVKTELEMKLNNYQWLELIDQSAPSSSRASASLVLWAEDARISIPSTAKCSKLGVAPGKRVVEEEKLAKMARILSCAKTV